MSAERATGLVNIAGGAGPTWSFVTARPGRLGQCGPVGADLVNVARRADPSWSMLPLRPGELVIVDQVRGPTWSMLPTGPTRLGQCRACGPADLVNLAWVGGRLGQWYPPLPPDLVNADRPDRPG